MPAEYWKAADHLAQLFVDNFKDYADHCTQDVMKAGPRPGSVDVQKKFEPEARMHPAA